MTTSDTPEPTPRSATLLESVDHTRSSLLDAVKTGILAYAAVWVVTFLIVGTALLAAVLEDDEGMEWSWALTAPGQAIALSSHGTFVDTSTTDMDEDFSEFDEGELDEGEGFTDEEFTDENEEFTDEDAGEELCCDEDDEFTDEEFTEDDEFSDEEFDEEEFNEDEFGGGSLPGEDFGEFTTTMRFSTVPLTVLGVMIAALWIASRRAERSNPTPSRNAVLTTAAVTGVTFAVLTWAVAFAARLHLEGSYGHAGTLEILFYGSVLGTAVSLLARRPAARRRVASRLPSALITSVRGVAVYLATFVALLIPAAAIYAIVKGEPEAILVFPLVILNAAVYGLTLGQLAGIELQGLPFFEDTDSMSFSLFSDDTERIMYVLIPLVIAALLLTVAVLARRSIDRPRTSVDAFWLIVTFAGAGALLTALSAVTTSTSSFGSLFGGGDGGLFSIGFAPAQWFFLVMAGWGVVTEIAIRIIGRPLAALVPDKLLDRLAGS